MQQIILILHFLQYYIQYFYVKQNWRNSCFLKWIFFVGILVLKGEQKALEFTKGVRTSVSPWRPFYISMQFTNFWDQYEHYERNLQEGQWEDRRQWSLGVGQREGAFWNRPIYIWILRHAECRKAVTCNFLESVITAWQTRHFLRKKLFILMFVLHITKV
jgi:hypothetical protein